MHEVNYNGRTSYVSKFIVSYWTGRTAM